MGLFPGILDYFPNFKHPIFTACLGFNWGVYSWETYLNYRQRQIYRTVREVPPELADSLDKTTFEKSRLYALDRSTFGFWHGLVSQLETTAILCCGGIPFLWRAAGHLIGEFGFTVENEIVQSLVFMLLANTFGTITDLPWEIYGTFVLEEKHGFNKETAGFFVWDRIKKFFISQLISAPILAGLIKLIQIGGDKFFIYTSGFIFVVVLVLMTVYPDFIAPLFDKFTPLDDGDLKTKLETLAASIGFPLKKILIVEGSKRSSHSNAYQYGFWKNKRIVLFDTLLEKFAQKENEKRIAEAEAAGEKEPKRTIVGCTDEEIVAIMGHELGHWKLSHILKNLAVMQANTLITFYCFGKLMNNQALFDAFGCNFGIPNYRPTMLGILIVFQFIFSPYNEVTKFLMTSLSRRYEFQADAFAAELGKAESLRSALLKLHRDNLSFPVDDWLHAMWTRSHPQVLDRLEALKKTKSE